jgi:hypothetical protein
VSDTGVERLKPFTRLDRIDVGSSAVQPLRRLNSIGHGAFAC